MAIEFYVVIDRESTNPAMSSNGGDYDFGRTVAVQDGKPVAVRHWTSADFAYCPHCANFDSHDSEDCPCFGYAEMREAEGWEQGKLLTGSDHERALRRFEGSGWFNPIRN